MAIKKLKIISHLALSGILLLTLVNLSFSVEIVPRAKYLDYARAAADWTWNNYDELIEKWKQRFDPESVFGYRPPGGLLEMSVIYSYLYEKEKKPEYARRVKKILLEYGDYRSQYPESSIKQRPDYTDGVPALPDFFTVMRCIRAYDTLNRLKVFNKAEKKKIESLITESMAYLLRTQEWGPMNRAALRAESLAWAVRALPGHPYAKKWEMQRKALGDDNWGNWQIEDATIYHGVWLYALCGYAHAMDKMDELFKTPYKNSKLKWAASTIARKFIDFDNPTNVGLGYIFLDCFLWGNDEVPAALPESLSQEVMEDVQGKKIVFRNGWSNKSTYLLLNYRDEGDGGLNFRDYLRDTIPVEEEKMTHGHSDENSIALLMSGGSVLLHDGGYRDYMPSGAFGAYRQDYFHNRLCVRPEKIWMGQKQGQFRYSIRDAVPGQSILDFLHNAGSYRIVRTQKIDFLAFPDFDYSRTRLIDSNMGYEWDRIITYVKDPEVFVVFDIFKSRKEEFFTLANLWHTRKILAQGEHWYDTVYDMIQSRQLSQDKHLLIVFPLTHYRLEGVEPEKRHYQDETLIHQTTAQHFELGETVGFVTVLIPHSEGESPQKLAEQVSFLPVLPERAGLGVQISAGNKTVIVGVKNDLRKDMARDWRRPKYTYDSGKISFGDIETNGDFVFASLKGTELDYTIVNLTKALYKKKVLVENKSGFFGLAFNGSPDTKGVGKLRYWRDKVDIRKK